MKRKVSLQEISDGRLYGLNDMVRADCRDCQGCSSCCCGMGSSIVLDPYDIFRLSSGLGRTASQLLQEEKLELNVVDGMVLPNLKLQGEEEACVFLNPQGRCSIHAFRPGICRLFPLGRYYEGRSFQYFLQIHECEKQDRTKVKVSKWIDTPGVLRYDRYICDWHYFLEDAAERLSGQAEEEVRNGNLYVLKLFYLRPYDEREDFYSQFYERLGQAREILFAP